MVATPIAGTPTKSRDSIRLAGNSSTVIQSTGTAVQSAALDEGFYDIWTDATAYIKVAGTANDVTTANGYIIYSGVVYPNVEVPANMKIGVISATGTVNVRYHKVS